MAAIMQTVPMAISTLNFEKRTLSPPIYPRASLLIDVKNSPLDLFLPETKVNMIRKLQCGLDITADTLVQPYELQSAR